MPNAIRGEAGLVAGGKAFSLLLTLGALAEIEEGLALTSLADIGPRLKQARAGDLAIVAAALLRGGGHDLTPADVLALPCDLSALIAAVSEAFTRAGLGNATGEGQGGPFAGTISSPSG